MSIIEKDLFNLYASQNIWSKFHIRTRYKRGRLWELEEYLPKHGSFLDLGCGHGVFAAFLALRSKSRSIIGVDVSESKIVIARNAACNKLNIEFLSADICNFKSNVQFDAVTLIDVLYLLPFALQKEILITLHGVLKDSGVLLISEVCKEKGLSFFKALLQEYAAVRLFKITKGHKFYFRRKEEWLDLLKTIGFGVSVIRRGTVNPTNLYICHRNA